MAKDKPNNFDCEASISYPHFTTPHIAALMWLVHNSNLARALYKTGLGINNKTFEQSIQFVLAGHRLLDLVVTMNIASSVHRESKHPSTGAEYFRSKCLQQCLDTLHLRTNFL